MGPLRALRVVVVGYGPVGARFADELLPSVRAGVVELTVVGAEGADAYNRVLVAAGLRRIRAGKACAGVLALCRV